NKGMAVSSTKSSYMLFGSQRVRKNNIILDINGRNLYKSKMQRFLGLHIDERFKFGHQLNLHKIKANQISNVIRIMNGKQGNAKPKLSLTLANSLLNSTILFTLPFMFDENMETKKTLSKAYEIMQGKYIKSALRLLNKTHPAAAIA